MLKTHLLLPFSALFAQRQTTRLLLRFWLFSRKMYILTQVEVELVLVAAVVAVVVAAVVVGFGGCSGDGVGCGGDGCVGGVCGGGNESGRP